MTTPAAALAPTQVRWRILALLVAAAFASYFLRTNMSVAGESMMTDVGLSEMQFGLVLAAFAWGYALFQIPGGLFGDAFGPRRALTIIMIAWGVVTLLTALAPGAGLAPAAVGLIYLVLIRFLMGAVHAPIFPIASGGTVSAWFPKSGWALPNGLTSTGLTIGAAATGPLIAWLTITFGWRTAFLVSAPLAFALAALWWWYGRDRPAEHPRTNAAEVALIEAGREPEEAPMDTRTMLGRILRNRDILLLAAAYFCMNYVFYLFFNWFYYYLTHVRGFDAQQGGYFFSAQWIAGAVAATLGGLACDALSKRIGPRWGCRIPAMTGLFLTAPFLIAGALAQDATVAVIFLSLSFASTQLTEGAFWAACISVSGRHATAASGVMNTGGNIAGGFGALIVPAIAASFGWTAAVMSGAIFGLLAMALWFAIRADRPL